MHPFWGRCVASITSILSVTYFHISSTEVGPATMYIPREAPHPHEWEYFKISKHIQFHMQPQKHMDGIYEPIMIVGPLIERFSAVAVADCMFEAYRDVFSACL